jgi:hypothetical protein
MVAGWWRSKAIPFDEVNAMPTIVKFERTLDAGLRSMQSFRYCQSTDGSYRFVMVKEPLKINKWDEVYIYYTTEDFFRSFVGAITYYGEITVDDWRVVDRFFDRLDFERGITNKMMYDDDG